MALRNEAADISGSSDIGPPPTSRFAEPDSPQSNHESPSKPNHLEEVPDFIPESPIQLPPQKSTETVKEEKTTVSPTKTLFDVPQTDTSTSQNTRPEQAARTGGKRKLAVRDESENVPPVTVPTTTTNTRRKATILREKNGNKTLKEMTAMRREDKGKQASLQAPALRKPLGAKSTNDDLMSPKKNANKTAAQEKPEKPEKPIRTVKIKQLSAKQCREPTKPKVAALEDRPQLRPAETTAATPAPEPQAEPAVSSPEPQRFSPTPEPKMRPQSHDTPPPADISSQGETSRPSRRSRAQVSYAEPNLRDKMRRPTKELVDAVTGEMRYRRSESLAPEEIAAIEQLKRESGPMDLSIIPPADPKAVEAPASPLARKEVGESLPNSVVTERRKRRSSVLGREAPAETTKGVSEDDSLDTSLSSMDSAESSGDIYEFPGGSPNSTEVEPARRPSTRRASRAGADAAAGEEARPSRKRASINVPRRTRQEVMESGSDGAVAEGVKDRSMRRRSTML